jgi:hypothetical protein
VDWPSFLAGGDKSNGQLVKENGNFVNSLCGVLATAAAFAPGAADYLKTGATSGKLRAILLAAHAAGNVSRKTLDGGVPISDLDFNEDFG